MFKNAYIQVALTYWRHMFSPWWIACLLLLAAYMMFFPFFSASNERLSIPFLASGSIIFFLQGFTLLSFLTCIHIREQFADARSHLLPGFRKAHITAAIAAVFLVAIVLPAAATVRLHVHSIGLVAFMTLWFGLACFAVLFQKPWHLWGVLIVYFAAMFSTGKYMGDWCSGLFELPAFYMLMIGLAIIILCGVRLVQITEDMPEYFSRFCTNAWTGKSAAGSRSPQKPGSFNDWLTASPMPAMIRHARRANHSLWPRVCRWQIGMLTGWGLLWFAGLIAIALFVPVFFILVFFPNSQRQFAMSWPVMAGLAFSLSAIWGALWRRRSQTMHFEILLPIERPAYLKQVGMAAVVQQLIAWGIFVLIDVVWQQLFAPKATVATVSALLYCSLLQIGMFGLSVWFLRFRSPLPFILGGLVLWIAFLPIVYLSSPGVPTPSIVNVLLSAAAFAVFGLLAAWDGYRRWLVTDIG